MTAGADQHRRNRRGDATRARMLAAALDCLATGDPMPSPPTTWRAGPGSTWGAVKYQFGDVDGLWAAVLDHLEVRRGGPLSFPGCADPIVEVAGRPDRLVAVAGPRQPRRPRDRHAADGAAARARRARAEVPADGGGVGVVAAELGATCQAAFADLDLDLDRVREVAALLPGAMRGLKLRGAPVDVLRPRPGPARTDPLDRGLPRGEAMNFQTRTCSRRRPPRLPGPPDDGGHRAQRWGQTIDRSRV